MSELAERVQELASRLFYEEPFDHEKAILLIEKVLIGERILAAELCIDMAERYDWDIEGCNGEELTRYSEGIECSMRLAEWLLSGREVEPKHLASVQAKREKIEAKLRCAVEKVATK